MPPYWFDAVKTLTIGILFAVQFSPGFYSIQGRRIETAGSTLKALVIAYRRFAPASTSPAALLENEAVDVQYRAGSYGVTFLKSGQRVDVPASAVTPKTSTLSNPHRRAPVPDITLLGPDVAALLVAAAEWARIPLERVCIKYERGRKLRHS